MRTLILVLFASFMVNVSAQAAGTVGKCVYEHQQCANQCLTLDTEGSQAACVAKCAGVEAQCVSGVGLEQSQPYLKEKAEQLEGMIQEFFGDILPTTPKEPTKQGSDSET